MQIRVLDKIKVGDYLILRTYTIRNYVYQITKFTTPPWEELHEGEAIGVGRTAPYHAIFEVRSDKLIYVKVYDGTHHLREANQRAEIVDGFEYLLLQATGDLDND